MTWAIFRKGFRDSRIAIVGWGLGLGAYAMLVASLYSTIKEQEAEIRKLIESMPSGFMNFIGGVDVLTTPAGLIQARIFLTVPLLLGFYVIILGIGAISGEERRQTMDVLVTLPIPRWQLLTEKLLSTGAIIAGILTFQCSALILSTQLWPDVKISAVNLIATHIGLWLLLMSIGGVAYLLSAALPMHRRWGSGIASAYLIASYLIYNLGNAVEVIKPMQSLTIFNYFDSLKWLQEGFQVGNIVVLSASIAILYLAALYAFERRDLGT